MNIPLGFQNQTYKDESLFKIGDSTRIIQTPSPSPNSSGPPASSREVSRRTNYCGYKPTSQKGDTDQFHSRVVDSTWMCKDKTCKGDNLNIKLPKDDPSKLKSSLAMVEALKRGDKVITSGGIVGTVERVIDNEKVEVMIADNVKVEIVRATGIQGLVTKAEPKK